MKTRPTLSKSFFLIFFVFINLVLYSQWETIEKAPYGHDIIALDSTIIITGYDSMFISQNNGTTFKKIDTAPDDMKRVLDYNNGKIYLGTQYGQRFYVSSDTGKTWLVKNDGIGSCTIMDIFSKDDLILAASYQSWIFLSKNNAETWTNPHTGMDTTQVRSVAITDSLFLASTPKGLYCSKDSAENWFLNISYEGGLINKFTVKDSIVYAATISTGLYVSYDYGKSWQKMDIHLENSTSIISRTNKVVLNDSLIFVSSNDGDFFSIDTGKTWYSARAFIFPHNSYYNGVINNDYLIVLPLHRVKLSNFYLGPVKINAKSNETRFCENDTINMWTEDINRLYTIFSKEGQYLRFSDTLKITGTKPENAGKYYVTGYNFTSEYKDSLEIIVNSPKVYIGDDISISNNEKTVINATKGFESYTWNNDISSNKDSLNIEGKDYSAGQHNIFVEVTDENNCSGSDTLILTIAPASSIFNEMEETGIKIYPVPFQKYITVENNNESGAIINLFTIDGKKIFEGRTDIKVKTFYLPVAENGLYILEIINNGNKTRKIIPRI